MLDSNSNKLTRRDNQRTIRLKTLDELHNAVLVYGGARAAALQENVRQIGESQGGMAAVVAMLGLPQNGDSFAEKVVREMGRLSSESGYHGSWDYDGPGPFHKCSLDAKRETDGTFSLNIRAAYVGNKPEIALAQSIGAPIGYRGCEIERVYAVEEGERFSIPLKDIEDIYRALGETFDPQVFLKALTTPKMNEFDEIRVDSYISPVSIRNDGGIKASVGLGSIPAYRYKDAPNRDYEYRIENGNLTGPARLAHDGNPEAIGIELSISPTSGLTYDTALEQLIRALGDRAETAWKATFVEKTVPKKVIEPSPSPVRNTYETPGGMTP